MSAARNSTDNSKAYGDLPEHLRKVEMGPPSMQNTLRTGLIFALISILGVAAFTITSFVGAPFALTVLINAWFAGSAIYLSGIGYGIINDLIGVKRNLPYFSLGHQSHQKALIKSNDRGAVGIAWGIFASMGFSLIAAALFTTATLITGFVGLPFAGFVLPILAAVIPLALLGGHLYSRYKEKQREKNEDATALLQRVKDAIDADTSGLNTYQNSRLKHWFKRKRDVNAWLGNSDRNTFGYISMPIIGVAGLATLITCSAVGPLLPAAIFGAAFSVFPPVGLGILLAVGISAACIYLYANHKKTVNNGYRLDHNEEAMEPQREESTHSKVARLVPNLDSEKKLDNVSVTSAPVTDANKYAQKPPVSLQFVPAPTASSKDSKINHELQPLISPKENKIG